MTDWTTTYNGIRVDNVTGEAWFGGEWFPTYTDAHKAQQNYRDEAALHAEAELDRRRDEREDYRMDV